MMIKAVIIDDEQNNIDNLLYLLQKQATQVSVSGTAQDAGAGKQLIEAIRPDLVFLDIQMPGKNGFELLQSLPGYEFEVIFVTAFDQYGIQAVKFAAIDYLLKPINPTELTEAINRVLAKRHQHKNNRQIENLLQLLQHQQQKEEHRIALPTARETRFVRPREIIRCESINNYTTFYFLAGDKLIVSKPLYEYDELLTGYGFIRCHQSHLVNRYYVRSWIKTDGGYLLLEDQSQIPVSRQKREIIREELERLK